AGIQVLDSHSVALDGRKLSSKYLSVEGWAATKGRSPVRGVYLTVDDTVSVWAKYGGARQDVAAYLQSQECPHPGYVGLLPRDRLGVGVHTLTLHTVLKDKQSFETLRTVQLVIR